MKKLYEDSLAEGNKFEHDREPEYVTKIIKYLERMNVNYQMRIKDLLKLRCVENFIR